MKTITRWITRKFRYSITPSMRRGMWGLAKSILLTLGALAGAYLWLGVHVNHAGSFDEPRLRAFLDAILAGVVGFTVVGSFTFLTSLKRPEEDRIDDRVAYLYSAKAAANKEANDYLKEQVTLLGAMISRADIRHEAIKVSDDGSRIQVTTVCTRIITNMMMHDRYSQTLPILIAAGKIPDMDEPIGWVRSIQTTAYTADGQIEPTLDRLPRQHALTNDTPHYEEKVALDIPPGGCMRYHFSYDMWVPSGDDFWVGANRFAALTNITFINQCGHDLVIEPFGKTDDDHTIPEKRDLPVGQEVFLGAFKNLPPEQNVTFLVRLASLTN